jgi:hypothetical protein
MPGAAAATALTNFRKNSTDVATNQLMHQVVCEFPEIDWEIQVTRVLIQFSSPKHVFFSVNVLNYWSGPT